MTKDKLRDAALTYHSQGRPGKIEVVPTKPYSSQRDLSLAYSPGVAEPCLAIKEDPEIPIMHDDQHGTAIISACGLLNALELNGKKIDDIRIVVNGAGAAAISCTRLYMALGAQPGNIVMLDSKGVINTRRGDLNDRKKPFATSRPINTLEEAMKGADMFLGLSVGNVLTPEMLLTMNSDPIVFALANPDPEIAYETAMATRDDLIFATGRSDYPNQINNVLGFPYIFRGALDVQATCINEEMKIAKVARENQISLEGMEIVNMVAVAVIVAIVDENIRVKKLTRTL